MRICGKALPPRAALLLTFDFTSLVFATPLLFVIPELARPNHRSVGELISSLLRLMFAGLFCQTVFYYNELYNLQVIRVRYAVLLGVLRAFGALFLFLAIASFISPELAPMLSRAILFALVLAPIVVISRLLALPRERERVLLIGSGEESMQLQETILSCPEWNLEVVQIVPTNQTNLLNSFAPKRPLEFDRVIVADARRQESKALERMLLWKMSGMPIEEAQLFFERAMGRVLVDGLTINQCIFSTHFNNGLVKRTAKRAFDLVAAILLLVLTFPIMLAVACAIMLQRDGPVLYKQERTGLYGKTFRIVKFRSMTCSSAKKQGGWAGEEKHRITRLGAVLRKYRLDELPQVWNVLRDEPGGTAARATPSLRPAAGEYPFLSAASFRSSGTDRMGPGKVSLRLKHRRVEAKT
jgi:uncharacterized membrane protein